MLKRKHLVLGFLTFCLTATLLIGATCSIEPYDPWKDIDENGKINILDILALAVMFGEEGTPINKTALLLELQERMDGLNGTLEARIPQKGVISVGAAAFSTYDSDYSFLNTGWYLYNHDNITTWFVASVQFPHNTTITSVTFHYYDAGADYMYMRLWAYNQTNNLQIAYCNSLGDTGHGSVADSSLYYTKVDNSKYHYALQVGIPASPPPYNTYYFRCAIIEYEYVA